MNGIRKILAIIFLSLYLGVAKAGVFICNIDIPINNYQIVQAYSGKTLLLNNKWVTVFILPSEHPTSTLALSQIGLSPKEIERIAKNNTLFESNIRIVNSEQEMILKVREVRPSIGYVMYYLEFNSSIKKCID